MSKRILFGCALFLLALTVSACGGGEQTSQMPPAGGTPAGGMAPAAAAPMPTAAVSGKVNFEGMAPKAAKIQMAADPYCASHSVNAMSEEAVVNADNTLQNVIVYVKSGVTGSFPTPKDPIVIDQKDCRYTPHVLTMMASQPLKIKNSDATLHNIHAWAVANTPFNIGQPVQNMETAKTFDKPEMPLPIRCDVHKWMSSFVGVFNHPYHAVTREAGAYEIKLPAGKYEIEAWHEKFGTQVQSVEVKDNDKIELNFTFKAGATSNN